MASFTISINIFAVFQLFCNSLRKVSSFGDFIFIVRSLFYEYCPKLSLNGIILKVNTLNYATKGMLFIEYEDRKWKPVAYFSKSLNKIERNYKIYNKKILAVIKELENWRYLLKEAKFKFEIWTNHKNLEYFMKVQKLSRRQAH